MLIKNAPELTIQQQIKKSYLHRTTNFINFVIQSDNNMPTFFTISGLKIQLFFKDHAPPHFHTSIAEFKAIISIEDGEILEG